MLPTPEYKLKTIIVKMCVFKNSIQVYKKKMLIIFIIKEKLGCHNLCVLYFSLGNVHIELLVLFVSCNVLLTKNTVQCSVSNVHNELRNILQFRKIYVTSWNTYSHWVRDSDVSEFCRLNFFLEFWKLYKQSLDANICVGFMNFFALRLEI